MSLFLSFLVYSAVQVAAVRLSAPPTVTAGVPVIASWSRDGSDPISFGVMERNLQNNQVKVLTTVSDDSDNGSGTVEVTFDAVGQVVLSGISQLSLSSGETPNQLGAGPQITVVQGSSNLPPAEPLRPPPPPPPSRTTRLTTIHVTSTRTRNFPSTLITIVPISRIPGASDEPSGTSLPDEDPDSGDLPDNPPADPIFSDPSGADETLAPVHVEGYLGPSDSANATPNLAPDPTAGLPLLPSGSNPPPITGASIHRTAPILPVVIGAIFALLLLPIFIFCICYRQRKRSERRISPFQYPFSLPFSCSNSSARARGSESFISPGEAPSPTATLVGNPHFSDLESNGGWAMVGDRESARGTLGSRSSIPKEVEASLERAQNRASKLSTGDFLPKYMEKDG